MLKRTLFIAALALLAADANARGGGHGSHSLASYHISSTTSPTTIAHISAARLGIPIAHAARARSFTTRSRMGK